MNTRQNLLTILAAPLLDLWAHQALATTDVTPAGPAWTAEATINGTIRNSNPQDIWRFEAVPPASTGLTDLRIASDAWQKSGQSSPWEANFPNEVRFVVDGAYQYIQKQVPNAVIDGLNPGFVHYMLTDAHEGDTYDDVDSTTERRIQIPVYDESNNRVPGATLSTGWAAAWYARVVQAQYYWDTPNHGLDPHTSRAEGFMCYDAAYTNTDERSEIKNRLQDLMSPFIWEMLNPTSAYATENHGVNYSENDTSGCQTLLQYSMSGSWSGGTSKNRYEPVRRAAASVLYTKVYNLSLAGSGPADLPARWSADVVVGVVYD
ncbi:hypothetical protein [Vibrio vulnificus]|uniref:hypothetical protein n=1 Tax=Vibrio vulnificus TaxID=672 RepID=UPI0005F1B6B7|nr:hypothetical protein [Vibrio vulnificus]